MLKLTLDSAGSGNPRVTLSDPGSIDSLVSTYGDTPVGKYPGKAGCSCLYSERERRLTPITSAYANLNALAVPAKGSPTDVQLSSDCQSPAGRLLYSRAYFA